MESSASLCDIVDLADFCDDVDLYALLRVQQRRYEEDGVVQALSTGFFFLSIWSQLVNNAWMRRNPSFAYEAP